MLSSLIRIETTKKNDIIPVIKTKKTRKSRKTAGVKPQPGDDNLEYSKFVPLDPPSSPAPVGFEEDDDDNVLKGDIVSFDDEAKFEDENDEYERQDMEWAEIMKEAEHADKMSHDESSTSEIEFSPSISYESDHSSHSNDYDNVDSDDNDSFFVTRRTKEPKEKPRKVYSGFVITPDDDDYEFVR
jgi:hypothetical protein